MTDVNDLDLSADAFKLEGHIGACNWGGVALVLDPLVAADDVESMISLLQQTAAVMRIHEDDFDEYCAARMKCDPEFAARLVAILGPNLDD